MYVGHVQVAGPTALQRPLPCGAAVKVRAAANTLHIESTDKQIFPLLNWRHLSQGLPMWYGRSHEPTSIVIMILNVNGGRNCVGFGFLDTT